MSGRAPRTTHDGVKISQREIKSCRFCYRQKVKCDKAYPCSRCVSRGIGHLCVQEPAMVNGRVIGGTTSPVTPKPLTMEDVMRENKALHRTIAAQEKTIRGLRRGEARESPDEAESSTHPRQEEHRGSTDEPSLAGEEVLHENDFVAGQANYYSFTQNLFGTSDDEGATRQTRHVFSQPGPSTLQALRSLVPLGNSSFLVEFHLTHLHWIHTVVHIPTFRDQHEFWLEGIKANDVNMLSYDFFALYFAIISCSLYFMDQKTAQACCGHQGDSISNVSRFWFDTSLNCLQLSDFLTHPTQNALQAICILPMIAHAFGCSAYVNSLMHIGLGLARGMKYHLLAADAPVDLYGGAISAELARRIWWCLMIADCLAPLVQHPFHVSFTAPWTSPPLNIEDNRLIFQGALRPTGMRHATGVSHVLLLGKVATIFREYCESFKSDRSEVSRFKAVKSLYVRFGQIFDDAPELAPRPGEVYTVDGSLPQPFDWRPWSRFLWSTLIPTFRICLYRWFLQRSYDDERFAEAREVCVNSARDMLYALRVNVPAMYKKNWHITTHAVLAGMVLSAELIYGKLDEASTTAIFTDIEAVTAVLRSTESISPLVAKSISTLESLIAELQRRTTAFNANVGTAPAISFEDMFAVRDQPLDDLMQELLADYNHWNFPTFQT